MKGSGKFLREVSEREKERNNIPLNVDNSLFGGRRGWFFEVHVFYSGYMSKFRCCARAV